MDNSYWRGVLTGIIVGAGAALLMAPKRGDQLRDELLDSADDWKDKAAHRAHDLKDNLKERGTEALDQAKQTTTEISAAVKDAVVKDSAKEKLETAQTIIAEKRDEVVQKVDEVTHKNDDDSSDDASSDESHHEVEVGAAMAQALGDDEMTAQAENGGEVQNVAGDDIAPSPAVRNASEKTLDEIQTQAPDSNTAPEEAKAAQAQPLEDKIAAAVEVARENADSSHDESTVEAATEVATDKVKKVEETVADKASEAADAVAEKANDDGEKTPDAVIDVPENEASRNGANSNAKKRGKTRRKRSPNT